MKIVFVASGHDPYCSRLYNKELVTLKKYYKNLSIVAPHTKKINVQNNFLNVIGIEKYKSRYNRFSALRQLYLKTKELDADILHCHEPDSLFVCNLLKLWNPKIHVIYDCHEFHPESFTEHIRPKFLRSILCKTIAFIEGKLASRCSGVITVNERLVNKFLKYNKSVTLLPNYPRLEMFSLQNNQDREFFKNDNINLAYIGNINEKRGLFYMVELLKELKSLDLPTILHLVGHVDSAQKTKALEYLNDNNLLDYCIFTGLIPHEEVIKYLTKVDIGLALFKNLERYRWSEPVKFFEYSAAALPVIMTKLPVHQKLLDVSQNGYLIEEGNVKEAALKIKEMFENRDLFKKLSSNSRTSLENNFSWESLEPRLKSLYERIEQSL